MLRQRGRLTDKDSIAPHHWPQPLHVERYAGIVGCAAAAEKKNGKENFRRCLSFTVFPPENLPTQTSPLPSRTLFLRPHKVHFALWSYERRFKKRFIDFFLSLRFPIHIQSVTMSGISGPVYGLEVPPGEILIPASMDFPASVSTDLVELLVACDSDDAAQLAPRRPCSDQWLTANLVTVPHYHGCCRSHGRARG